MATVRKKSRVGKDGRPSTIWYVDYRDPKGVRHRPEFSTKAAAEQERIRIEGQLAGGVHIADRNSITLTDAGARWVKDAEQRNLELSTTKGYSQHVELHLKPFIGSVKLSRLSPPQIERLKGELLESGRSEAMVARILSSLRMLLGWAQRNGHIATNPAQAVRLRRRGRKKERVVVPKKQELSAILAAAAEGDESSVCYAHAYLATAIFSGLRASELRGLTWNHILLSRECPTIEVHQRADRWNVMGDPKSEASHRIVPIGPELVKILRRWRIACPKGKLDLVFPTSRGTIQTLANIYNRIWVPVCKAAGIADTTGSGTNEGPGKVKPWYKLHSLRHAYASLLIEQGLKPKVVQERMGHASIQMTFDLYGHLWPDEEGSRDSAAAIERQLLG